MKTHTTFILSIITLLCCKVSLAQIGFEPGYYVNENDQRVECFIKNKDWRETPSVFNIKLTPESETEEKTIAEIKEFGIYKTRKYIRATVQIDSSPEEVHLMSYDRNPVFEEKTIFLRELIAGKASLFLYENGDLKRYFFKKDNSKINQLVYKRYRVRKEFTSGNTLERQKREFTAQNNLFRQQLFLNLKCEGIIEKDVKYLPYSKKSLEKFIIKYNECVNSDFEIIEEEVKRDLINLTIRPGISFSKLTIHQSSPDDQTYNLGSQSNLRLGLELEFPLPFNRGKWAIAFEPTFQSHNAEDTRESSNVVGGSLTAKVDYRSVEFPIILRHYFFLSRHSKLFINSAFQLDIIQKKTSIKFIRSNETVYRSIDNPRTGVEFSLGGGFKYRNKFSVEGRYHTPRNFVKDSSSWEANFQAFHLIFGYTLF